MPLKVIRRPDTGTLQITGIVRLASGERVQVRRRASANSLRLAREEAAALEARLLRDDYHGERRGARSYATALESYLAAAPRGERDSQIHLRILDQLRDVLLADVDQEAVNRVRRTLLAPHAAPDTIRRSVITPIRAVLNYAAQQGWCTAPRFVSPKVRPGRTNRLLPDELERLVAAAAPHLAPLLLVLADTGARLSEALEALWEDIDLSGGRINFVRTKSDRPRRGVPLSPRTVAALAMLPHRDAEIFRTQTGEPYKDRRRQEGGQIKTAFHAALRRADLSPEFTPHDLRHTWASWHYAVHRDLLRLKVEGGWSSVALVERYAHLMPAGLEDEIALFWGWPTAGAVGLRA